MRRRKCSFLTLSLLESRVTPATLWNQGDFYRVDGREIPLLERAGQVAVRFSADYNPTWTESGGTLAGLNLVSQLGSRAAILEYAPAPKENLAEAMPIMARPGVAWSAPVFETTDTHGWVVATEEVVVRLKPDVTEAQFFLGDDRFVSHRRLEGTPDQFIATLPSAPGRAALAMAEELTGDARLMWATPSLCIQSRLLTNDTFYSSIWHLNNTGQSSGKADADIDAPEAWAVTTGSANIVIADIDDAIERDHPDLAPNVWTNPGEIAGNGIDDDANGYIDDNRGWDTWDNDNNPSPNVGSSDHHGTATAGLAVAAGNNSLGVVGVAYTAKLMPIRSNIVPALSPPDVPTAIYYAAGRTADGKGTWRGADIATNSWAFDAEYQPLNDAIVWASANGRGGKGLPMFFATGNGGTSSVVYPANLSSTITGVMAVGGSTHNDVRASYSQYGPETDFVTPTRAGGGGGGIYTTDRTGASGYSGTDYTSGFSGTSASTPIAAGVGALALSLNPNLTAAQLRGLLRNTTDLIGALNYGNDGKNLEYGYGRLNAFTAVSGVGVQKPQVFEVNTIVASGSGSSAFSATTAAPQTKTFRIRNQGTLDLNLGLIAVAGPYSVNPTFGDSVLSVGESTTFSITFAPTTGGNFNVPLSFSTNSVAIPNYTFMLNGTATDVSAPTVQSYTIGDGTDQRSRILSLGVTFNEIVTSVGAPENAFRLTGPGGVVPLTASLNPVGSQTVATLGYVSGEENGSLPDGNYTLEVLAGQIKDAANNLLASTASTNFHRLYGDIDGNTHIDLLDFGAFRNAFNTNSVPFDWDNSGSVGLSDFAQFRDRYGI